jgi:demethylmenaquinone methyltransferase / 2-methoxy-6-polyprenyl-1,4-benzoquinol methylase
LNDTPIPSTGTRPAGTHDEQSAAAAVREMFDQIAPRYDLLNHILSLNVDRLWWWRTARRFKSILEKPEAQILDLCCGTGHMTLRLLRRRPANAKPVLACDFSHQMLLRGKNMLAANGAFPFEADALHLPLPSASIDLIVVAFGFRNLANYQEGLEEFFRVLKPNGRLGILDFSEPPGVLGKLYAFYFRRVLPKIGAALSGVRGAYEYLPSSVHRFPPPQAMLKTMELTGFRQTSWTPYNFGVAGLYHGSKP